eukprot:Cvel_30018.t1-p1 / transcript=Cvel_30018.t1 / gene=Cvel_30018 / organism=Chromera_velia_CCMP2878 / gene_product=hypothetical protein / transcript_product=hypothetical protein / location=Cvel_scaffold4216:1-869(-) / protein_length=210 / sequence_SO=supercontig / SO=protein_coding / is_pseudo=false
MRSLNVSTIAFWDRFVSSAMMWMVLRPPGGGRETVVALESRDFGPLLFDSQGRGGGAQSGKGGGRERAEQICTFDDRLLEGDSGRIESSCCPLGSFSFSGTYVSFLSGTSLCTDGNPETQKGGEAEEKIAQFSLHFFASEAAVSRHPHLFSRSSVLSDVVLGEGGSGGEGNRTKSQGRYQVPSSRVERGEESFEDGFFTITQTQAEEEAG